MASRGQNAAQRWQAVQTRELTRIRSPSRRKTPYAQFSTQRLQSMHWSRSTVTRYFGGRLPIDGLIGTSRRSARRPAA